MKTESCGWFFAVSEAGGQIFELSFDSNTSSRKYMLFCFVFFPSQQNFLLGKLNLNIRHLHTACPCPDAQKYLHLNKPYVILLHKVCFSKQAYFVSLSMCVSASNIHPHAFGLLTKPSQGCLETVCFVSVWEDFETLWCHCVVSSSLLPCFLLWLIYFALSSSLLNEWGSIVLFSSIWHCFNRLMLLSSPQFFFLSFVSCWDTNVWYTHFKWTASHHSCPLLRFYWSLFKLLQVCPQIRYQN